MDSVTPPIAASNAGTPISQNVSSRTKGQQQRAEPQAISNGTISDTIETSDRDANGGMPWSAGENPSALDEKATPTNGDQLDLSA